MKKILFSLFLASAAVAAHAQTTFSVSTPPCNRDGVLSATFPGILTPPLTVAWRTNGSTGGLIIHTSVTGLTDALTAYSGGPVSVVATDALGVTDSGIFAGAHPINYDILADPSICPAMGRIFDTGITGGTAPYVLQWYNMATLAAVGTGHSVVVPVGQYGIKITDAAGCVYGSEVDPRFTEVIGVPSFSVLVSTTTANCTDGSATVSAIGTAVPPFSYRWSTGATTPSISSLVTGTYSAELTDALGCSGTGFGFVNQAVIMSVPVTATPATCTASDGAVIGFGSGGVPPYTYLWSNGSTAAAQTGIASGFYTVVATDANGCLGNGSAFVGATTPITVTYTATPSLCTAPTGSATVNPVGGVGPYTITWHTYPVQTGNTATALPPGNYPFSVTDATGCVRDGVAVISPISVISATYTTVSPLCLSSTGGITVTPSGGVMPYTYSWSTGGTGTSVSSIPTGSYNVTIRDNVGCTISKSIFLPSYSPVTVGLSSTPATFIFNADATILATPTGGTAPYTYSWSGGGSTSLLSGLPNGFYQVTVTDAAGCKAYNAAAVGYDTLSNCYCTISGIVYNDTNSNCTQDPGENGIPNIQMRIGTRGYTYTDARGVYSFKVPAGTYIVTEVIKAFHPLSPCQINNISVTASPSTGCVLNVDFANNTDTLHDMHISTWNYTRSAPIPGNDYATITIVSNNGTLPEDSILASYKSDGQLLAPTFMPSMVFRGSSFYYNTSDSLVSLAPGTAARFLQNYFVPTDIPLGTNVVVRDTVTNKGPMSNWLSDYSPWNNVNNFSTTVVASYDPNFKEVNPKGTGPLGLISYTDSILEYMVHFQNTGTYQAENIFVLDTLDDNLDWTTLMPGYMTHNGQVTVEQKGARKVVKFNFPNINLPAEMDEPIASNGMFTYTIKTRSGLPIGTQFKNRASIYFDYNAPIVTNTTVNTLGSVAPAPSAVSNVSLSNAGSFTVCPNPASLSFNAIINSDNGGAAIIKVSDVTGKQMMIKQVAVQKGAQTIHVDAAQLAAGVYFVTLHQNGATHTQKLVIMK
jgi:uncharacterized repeat protein (TIGR01451 family)